MGARAWWWGEGGTAVGALAFRYQAGDSLANLRATFTRASTATYIDANGVLQTAASGVARDNHYVGGVRTLLLEGQRTNSFLNSGTPATHTSPSLATGTYTLWLVGTGSIAVAGATATITGAGTATSASPVTFTVTVAGTVTFTVTGTPTRAQCENGAFASSYIATAGSAVTRSADFLTFPWNALPQALTAYLKFVDLGTGHSTSMGVVSIGGTGAPRQLIYVAGSNLWLGEHQNGSVALDTSVVVGATGTTVELNVSWDGSGSGLMTKSDNGGAIVSGSATGAETFASAYAQSTVILGAFAGGNVGFAAFQSLKIALAVNAALTDMRSA